MKDINRMCFSEPETATEFINSLCEISLKDSYFYNDIHTYTEENYIIVEWVQIPHSREYGGSFQYVDENQSIMTCYQFPDNHYEFLGSEDEYCDALHLFLTEHPYYKQNQFGRWYDERDVIELEKAFKGKEEK
jgi:hypothetical protein